MGEEKSFKLMGAAAAAVAGLAAVTLTGIAVVSGYKDTGKIDNSTADLFIAGMAIFATFTTVIALALVGKIVIGLFK